MNYFSVPVPENLYIKCLPSYWQKLVETNSFRIFNLVEENEEYVIIKTNRCARLPKFEKQSFLQISMDYAYLKYKL